MANKTIVDLETDLVKPYIDSVKSQLSVGGSIDLAPNYLETTVNNGITWTKNSDGTVTANGTASANSTVNFTSQIDNWYLPAGTYKITGCPSGGSSTKYYIRVYNIDSSAVEIARDYGSGDTFTLAARTRVSMTATIISGQAVSNLVFKPMVTVSTYSGDYVPYAATNKDLTDIVLPMNDLTEVLSSHNLWLCPETIILRFYYPEGTTPEDWDNLTSAQANATAQAVYDFMKSLDDLGHSTGGVIGRLHMQRYAASDPTTVLGTTDGIFKFFSSKSYATCIADNTKTRMTLEYLTYGIAGTYSLAVWGKTLRVIRDVIGSQGRLNDGGAYTIDTIST